MDFFSSMRVSTSALNAHLVQLNSITSNLANTKTTRGAHSGPYLKKEVIFSAQVDRENFAEILENEFDEHVQGVQVIEIIENPKHLQKVYEPNHPDADSQGYITLPGINPVEEIANLITCQRSYEANVTALEASKSMYTKTLMVIG